MIEMITSADIAAPRATVWSVFADFPRYGEWNPYIRAISGPMEVGARLSVTAVPPGAPGRTFQPVVTGADPGRLLRWAGALWRPALFVGEHIFEFFDAPDGGTRFVHREEFSGLLMPLHRAFRLAATRRGFEAMNRTLAARAEAVARGHAV